MTSGVKNVDRRVSVICAHTNCLGNATYTNTQKVGEYFHKDWSGGDTTPTIPIAEVFHIFRYRIFRKNGTSFLRKKKVRLHRRSNLRATQENGYTCNIVHRIDNVATIFRPEDNCTSGYIPYDEQTTEGYTCANPGMSNLFGPNEDLRLYDKLNSKISGDGFNMAIFLGEGKQSLETIAEAARRIALAMKYLKRGNVFAAQGALLATDPKRGFKSVDRRLITDEWLASNWLQLQYGWKPLVNDIYGAAEHFAHMQNRPQILTYRTGRRIKGILTESAAYRVDTAYKAGKTIKAIVEKIDEYALLGLQDPASVAWELMPWSFVADWVIPVGSYLRAINLNRALTAKYVISSKYHVAAYKAIYPPGIAPGGVNFVDEFVHTERVVVTHLPVRLPVVKPWEKISSFGHVVNSLALLTASFSGSVKGSGRPR